MAKRWLVASKGNVWKKGKEQPNELVPDQNCIKCGIQQWKNSSYIFWGIFIVGKILNAYQGPLTHC